MVIDKEFLYGIDVAMRKLRPNSTFVIYNNEFIEWNDTTGAEPPTWDEVMFQVESDKIEYNRQQYARSRALEYGSAEVEIDKLWHLIDSGTIIDKDSEWYKTVKSIKEKYPKPY